MKFSTKERNVCVTIVNGIEYLSLVYKNYDAGANIVS